MNQHKITPKLYNDCLQKYFMYATPLSRKINFHTNINPRLPKMPNFYRKTDIDTKMCRWTNYTVSQKKTSPTFLAITRESIDRFL